ncbi:hypothetical protein KDAU_64420 [Dictyobacter aurantiacus]|uniref:Uncharacterized protein n=1 Tax=Dictyobacter aurantiacus TaxID=1936993 RepID=A0A401ZQG0_9CHLR|nr:hypothetical protein KDAU_64420 [Dictyobacter aurantiacus]
MQTKYCLNLSQFNPLTSYLHLVVNSTYIRYFASSSIFDNVSCPVQPSSRFIAKRVRHKSISCNIWPLEVTARHSYTTNVQFAWYTNRNWLHPLIQNIDLRIYDGTPNQRFSFPHLTAHDR